VRGLQETQGVSTSFPCVTWMSGQVAGPQRAASRTRSATARSPVALGTSTPTSIISGASRWMKPRSNSEPWLPSEVHLARQAGERGQVA